MGRLRRYVGWLLTSAVLSVGGQGRAADETGELPREMRLEYVRGVGARECPDEDTFRFVVAGRMSFSPFVKQAPDRMVVSIRRRGGGFQGLAEIRNKSGTVLWSFPTTLSECHLVTDALGLAIGLALDPPRPKVETPPPPPPPPPPPVVIEKVVSAPVKPRDEGPRDEDRIQGRGALGSIFGVGLLPRPGFGPTASLGIQWRRFSVMAEGRALFTPSFDLAEDHSAFAVLGLGVLSFAYEIPLPKPFHSLEVMPLLGAGRMIVKPLPTDRQQGYHTDIARPSVVMAGVRLPVSWQITRKQLPVFYIRAFVEADLDLYWTSVSYNYTAIWGERPPIGATFGIEVSAVVRRPRKADNQLPSDSAGNHPPMDL